MWQMPWAVQSSKLGPKLLDLDADGDGGDLVIAAGGSLMGRLLPVAALAITTAATQSVTKR